MYFLGIFLSIGSVLLMFLIDAGREFISTTYRLSPEITVLVLVGYVYPLLLFAFTFVVGKKGISRKFFHSQATLGSTLCVSLGLIGTFIGLSSMVASISSGMNADGDFSEKINTLLASIGTSLDAMSLAFLTSILGVGASTVLLVSCNYLALFYDNDDKVEAEPAKPIETQAGIVSSAEIAEAIGKALDQTVFEKLSESIAENNILQNKLIASLDKMESTQNGLLTDGISQITHFSDQVVHQMSESNKNIQSLEGVIESFGGKFEHYIDGVGGSLEKVSDASSQIASGVDNNSGYLQSVQLLLQRLDENFQSYTVDFNGATSGLSAFSNQFVSEVGAVNTNLQSLQQFFVEFDARYQDNAANIDQILDVNSQSVRELASIMFDLKFLLAPPLDETLEAAIKNNSLDIRYQSQVNTNNEVVGCEVLLQWRDSIRGVISNADIFGPPMQHHTELMVDLDKWVIENSIKQLSEWIQEGTWQDEWVLSINVVPQMATDFTLVSYLKELMVEHSVNPANIAIEFKESIILESFDTVKEIFGAIKSLGTKIYVDNYGKSHSSLVIYKQLNVDKLKIDRTVINDLIDEDGDTSVLRSIMASAKELGLELMAEGVENDIQKAKLEELGFNQFQGYFVSHPISGVECLS